VSAVEHHAVSEINITPLIDVMLVLLIIFMVVAPVPSRGLDTSLPQEAKGRETVGPSHPVVLEIEAGGMTVNRQPVADLAGLAERIADVFQARADRTLFVRAAGDVDYGRVVAALDVTKGAGVERIGLMLDQTSRSTLKP
jgi:biopolymer transport protein ExbD